MLGLVVKRQMDQHWCEFENAETCLTGDDRRNRLVINSGRTLLTVDEKVYDSCKKRKPLFQRMKALRHVEQTIFRRVHAKT